MKACASKNTAHYHKYRQFMRPPLSTHQRHNRSKSHTMNYNGTALRGFINGAWITWIYLFAIFIRLEYVDAKIGKIMPTLTTKYNIIIIMPMCSVALSHFLFLLIGWVTWTYSANMP